MKRVTGICGIFFNAKDPHALGLWYRRWLHHSLRPASRTARLRPDFHHRLQILGTRSMTRQRISSGSTFENEIGYSRAVVDGNWVFVSGTTGFDYASMTIAPDIVEQTEQCLKNIGVVLEQAGACFGDVVRVTYVVPDAAEFEQCWPVLRKYFGEVRPAAMMISAGLADPRMRIEIEVTALKRSS